MQKINKSKEDWKKELDEMTYKVTREKDTEAPYSGEYNLNHEDGVYTCSNCGLELFKSDAKYDSNSGWPSFFTPLVEDRIELHQDNSYGMNRVEVVCARCDAHLGHLFDDGPQPTGQRYCINSVSLKFQPEKN